MCPNEAGFLLFINSVEGKAIPEEPMDGMDPKVGFIQASQAINGIRRGGNALGKRTKRLHDEK